MIRLNDISGVFIWTEAEPVMLDTVIISPFVFLKMSKYILNSYIHTKSL